MKNPFNREFEDQRALLCHLKIPFLVAKKENGVMWRYHTLQLKKMWGKNMGNS